MIVVLEFTVREKDKGPTVFGPFQNDVRANEFINARIATLADGWTSNSYITQDLYWLAQTVHSPK